MKANENAKITLRHLRIEDYLGLQRSMSEAEAIRHLAAYPDPLREKFREFALSYNVNIITGSMPMVHNEQLYNVGF